jgi:transitional endoplasmic reticulum ATPase
MTVDYRLNILNLPGAQVFPLDESELVTNLWFVPLTRRLKELPGVLVDSIELGSFRLIFDVSS